MKNSVVIIGSGIAGLTLAYKLSLEDKELEIIILTKAALNNCNTRLAQGGVAAVMTNKSDAFESHIKDTLACGRGLCNEEVVKEVVMQAPERINELIEWGVSFDQTKNQKPDLALEGGHSEARILHHKDSTGSEIESVLITKVLSSGNITILEDHSALELLIKDEGNEKYCVGLKVIDWKNKMIKTLPASKVVLASGGCGQLYLNTTNSPVATGDGYAIAKIAGVQIRDMRFMQFHPSALYLGSAEPVSFLISEAVRGFGAYVVDKLEQRFLFRYDLRGELATRDIVSAAIMDHLKKTAEKCVYLDLRHLNELQFREHFPSIANKLSSLGFDFAKDLIPVTPSAHYQCGGIVVDLNGESNIKDLYAIGEVSSTGLHGANRLASNSLLEALVYAHQASKAIISSLRNEKELQTINYSELLFDPAIINETDLNEKNQDLKQKMMASAFDENIASLEKKRKRIREIQEYADTKLSETKLSAPLLELQCLSITAGLILDDKIRALKVETTETYLIK